MSKLAEEAYYRTEAKKVWDTATPIKSSGAFPVILPDGNVSLKPICTCPNCMGVSMSISEDCYTLEVLGQKIRFYSEQVSGIYSLLQYLVFVMFQHHLKNGNADEEEEEEYWNVKLYKQLEQEVKDEKNKRSGR